MKVTLFAWEMNFNIFVEMFFLLIGEDRGGNDTEIHDLFFCLEMFTEWMLYCLPVYFFLVGSGSLGRSQRGEWFLGNLVVCLEKLFPLLHFQLFFVKTTLWSDCRALPKVWSRFAFTWSSLCSEQAMQGNFCYACMYVLSRIHLCDSMDCNR